METHHSIHGSFSKLLKDGGIEPLSSPDLSIKDAANITPTHGTTIIAAKFKDGVLNVSDRRATANNVIMYDEADKIMALDDFTLISIAGAYASAIEAVRFLKHSFRYYERSQLQELSLEGKLSEVTRILGQSLPGAMQGIGGFIPLISAFDRTSDAGRIFYYDIMGARFETREFAAAGSGSVQIRGAFDYVIREKGPFKSMTLKKVLKEIFVLLDVAASLDSATGGLAGLAPVARIVTANGVADVDEKLVQETFEAAIDSRAALGGS
jgi:proteasome beta subunit